MKFWKTVKKCLKEINFKGRDTRKDYIVFKVFQFVFGFLGMLFFIIPLMVFIYAVGVKTGALPETVKNVNINTTYWGIYCIIAFFIYLPLSIWIGIANLCVSVKRLHDFNISGWYYLGYIIILICLTFIKDQSGIASSIVTLAALAEFVIFACVKGTDGPNKFDIPEGENQKQVTENPDGVYLLNEQQANTEENH